MIGTYLKTQCAPVKTTDRLIREPPQKEKLVSAAVYEFLFTIATIQGNSPYSASLFLLPLILKSIPLGFLLPQPFGVLGGLAEVPLGGLVEVPLTVLLVGDDVVVDGLALGSNPGDSPPFGI